MDDQDLQQRYGAPSRARRGLLIGVSVAIAVVFGVWLGWVALFHGNPDVTSELVGFEIIDDHTATTWINVSVHDDVDATCTVRATSEDHTIVGEQTFSPTDGRNDVTIRTEREATAVEKVGCTTPDQSRPR